MIVIGYAIQGIATIGCLICWVMTLILMFKNEKPLIGIIGVICALWAFIWGWMNATKLNHKKIMLGWSLCIVLSIVGGSIAGIGVANSIKNAPQTVPSVTLPS